jgi:hypothetical protein
VVTHVQTLQRQVFFFCGWIITVFLLGAGAPTHALPRWSVGTRKLEMNKIIFSGVAVMIAACCMNFNYIQDHWQVSLTMIFGSLIAGATSEGGGAVAFPVFTKLLDINPTDAKNFHLLFNLLE